MGNRPISTAASDPKFYSGVIFAVNSTIIAAIIVLVPLCSRV